MSTAALPVHVALVDDSGEVGSELSSIAGALSEQILHDFEPVWRVRASVGAYAAAKVPAGCWSVRIQKKLDQPGALGYHTDAANQPVAYVEYTGADTSVTVSHEVLEMLADPWGNHMHQGRLPRSLELDYKQFGLEHQSSYVHYLLEVCDPCEATSYAVGGVSLSDFLTSRWYRSSEISTGGYSHAGGCQAPREVADGGYASFANPAGEWYQAFNQGGQLQIQDIGRFDRSKHGSLREFTDAHARGFRREN